MSKSYLCDKCRQELKVSESDDGTAILIRTHRCDDRNVIYNLKLEKILEFIRTHEKVTTGDIAEFTGENVPNATRYLYDLMDSYIISRDTTVRPYEYYINQQLDVDRPTVVLMD